YAMQAKLKAATAHLEMEFPCVLVKKAPVSGRESVMDYTARFDATACGREIDFVLTVQAAVTTLCPCSKAIARYGAHNQRGVVTVQIRSRRAIWIEDLISLIESSASSELYSLLKRQDGAGLGALEIPENFCGAFDFLCYIHALSIALAFAKPTRRHGNWRATALMD